jgi:hypothetical protein
MATVEDLHNKLRVAAALLDNAAGEIRDLPLAPTKQNVRHIGEALASIFEIMRAIYAVRPDLTPAALKEGGPPSEANERLTDVFGKAIRLVEEGQTSAAIELLSSYVESENSRLHREIALDEINRLKGGAAT